MSKKCVSKDELTQSLRLACSWLTEIAQIKCAKLSDGPANVTSRFNYDDYRGAIKGEYSQAQKQWSDFCPIWHTGQATLALAQASQVLDDSNLLESARFSADFIMRNQITDKSDKNYGLIKAYEGEPEHLNTSAIMEALAGLIELYKITSENLYLDACKTALDWIAANMFMPEEDLMIDLYKNGPVKYAESTIGRPLVEDSVFLVVGKMTNDENLKSIFFKIIGRLLKDEDPPGNWMKYRPCVIEEDMLHPRHAYWWGTPFIDAYLETKDERYLQVAIRAGRWYINAQRADGGLFRHTYRNFNTYSFGHVTSGMACAVKMWSRLWEVTKSDEWLEPVRKGLNFCLKMQIKSAQDENLQGVIVEKVLMPDGTDRPLIHIRDLGTIFYIQAVCEVLSSGLHDKL